MRVLIWLHTDLHPLHARWVCLQAVRWQEQVSTPAHFCIPPATDAKAGWLPPQTSVVREGWHRDAHSLKGEGDRCEEEFSPHTCTHTHTFPQRALGEPPLPHQTQSGGMEGSSHMGANTYLIHQDGGE